MCDNMYSQIIFHKTVRALEIQAKAAFVGLASAGKIYPSFREVTEAAISSLQYLVFDDSYFWSKLAQHEEDESVPVGVRSIITRTQQAPAEAVFRHTRPLPARQPIQSMDFS